MRPHRTLLVVLFVVLAGCGGNAPTEGRAPASFVGRQVCASCHEQQAALWQGSQHDLAMQNATDATVLGDFGDVVFEHLGVESTFTRRDGRFYVRTDGAGGKLHDFEVKYCFGVTPLQQYLIEQPGGRLQVLGICWDSRPKESGGQRWFHIYQDEKIPPGDPLHWTGRDQNWNFMCAECHSTQLRKRFDFEQDRYRTTWAELDVSCEACHGPGSAHVSWARLPAADRPDDTGLTVQLDVLDADAWFFAKGESTASRKVSLNSNAQVETCARCHSRRSVLTEDYVHGQPLLDSHRPSLLHEGLYHADGQILEEVYVYGSFLQSRMYHRGVTCSSCHEPHGLRLRAEGNALCVRCHDRDQFDGPQHHHHEGAGRATQCVECHMPTRTYMVVDPRRDHSLRVPRPDLSRDFGTPNACNGCHDDKTAAWAAEAVVRWYGPTRTRGADWTRAIKAGRRRRADAPRLLRRLAADTKQPGIVRATAFDLLQAWVDVETVAVARSGVEDRDPLVRAAALTLFEALPDVARRELVTPLLADPIRAVRIEAVRVLGAAAAGMQSAALDAATRDYVTVQEVNADRPESHVNLAVLALDQGRTEDAERELRRALKIEPDLVTARVNLADLYRRLDRDADGERVLREGLDREPGSGALHHVLGLLLVRRGKKDDGLRELGKAAALAPREARFSYAYGVALNSLGRTDTALGVLEQAHRRQPGDRNLLIALATIHRDQGHRKRALAYARKLLALAPADREASSLVRSLER